MCRLKSSHFTYNWKHWSYFSLRLNGMSSNGKMKKMSFFVLKMKEKKRLKNRKIYEVILMKIKHNFVCVRRDWCKIEKRCRYTLTLTGTLAFNSLYVWFLIILSQKNNFFSCFWNLMSFKFFFETFFFYSFISRWHYIHVICLIVKNWKTIFLFTFKMNKSF